MLWHCLACTTAYAVGLPACPQCGGTEYVEGGPGEMPKITLHGGPSYAQERPGEAGDRFAAVNAPEPTPVVELPIPPAVTAPKADWVEHAAAVVEVHPEPDTLPDPATLTKPELIQHFGSDALPDTTSASE